MEMEWSEVTGSLVVGFLRVMVVTTQVRSNEGNESWSVCAIHTFV